MLNHLAAIPLLSLTYLSIAQVADPPIPPEIGQDHAQHVISSTASRQCEAACSRIATKLPAQVHFSPSLIDYIWSAQQGELTPACRVEPQTAKEVAFIYNTVKEERCHFAIKSGGHGRTPGTSNADGGVTIDLAKLNQVKLSKHQKTVVVGAGAQWVDVYRPIEEHGLSVVGGRVADVGVGGLLTGGGLSYWSNRYGWGCDNIVSYEIVLPDGKLATVDQTHHPDLYRALRGAGPSNFGIITSFELQTVTLPNKEGIWQSFAFRSWDDIDALLDEQHELLTKKTVEDQDAVYLNAYGYNEEYASYWATTMLYHVNHPDNKTYPSTFAVYESMKTLAPPDTRILPYSNITEMIKGMNPKPGKRNFYTTFTHRPSKELDRRLLEIFQEGVSKVANVTGVKTVIVVQPIYQNALRMMSKRGGNALGLAEEADDGPLNIVLLPWLWEHAADDEFVHLTIQEILRKGEALAKELGVYHPYKYINYAEGLQDVISGYGEKNLNDLRKTQRKYDPEGIYARGGLAGGFFKLSEKEEAGKMAKDSKKITGKMKAQANARDEL